jgi:hypothetical protein
MPNYQGNKRQIIRLPEFPRSATPEPETKKQRTSRSSSSKHSGVPKEARIATTASVLNTSDRVRVASSSRVTRSAGIESPSDRKREPLRQLAAEPARDHQEAALEDARVMDSPTRVLNSSERLSKARSACILNTFDRKGEVRVPS